MSVPVRLLLLGVSLAVATSVHAQADPQRPIYRPLSLSLVHPLTTFVHKDPIVTGLSLNLLDGNPRWVYGLEVGVVLNRTRERLYGLQVAGFTNLVLGELAGVQATAGVNVVLGPSWGVQLGGLWNHASSAWTPWESGFSGVQLSPVGNSAALIAGVQQSVLMNVAGQMSGAQLGFVNIAYAKLDGLQLGAMNIHTSVWHVSPPPEIADAQPQREVAHKVLEALTPLAFLNGPPNDPFWPLATFPSHLVQIGLGNVVHHAAGLQLATFNTAERIRGLQWAVLIGNLAATARGAQLAPLFNIARTQAEGFQLALINVCGALRGVQLGLVNICDRVRGVQIGAINIAYRNKVPFLPVLNIGL